MRLVNANELPIKTITIPYYHYYDMSPFGGSGKVKTSEITVTGCLKGDIDNAPTIDAVPVVHGKWSIESKSLGIYGCSVCDCVEETRSAYCPNCGAKMDGDV